MRYASAQLEILKPLVGTNLKQIINRCIGKRRIRVLPGVCIAMNEVVNQMKRFVNLRPMANGHAVDDHFRDNGAMKIGAFATSPQA